MLRKSRGYRQFWRGTNQRGTALLSGFDFLVTRVLADKVTRVLADKENSLTTTLSSREPGCCSSLSLEARGRIPSIPISSACSET